MQALIVATIIALTSPLLFSETLTQDMALISHLPAVSAQDTDVQNTAYSLKTSSTFSSEVILEEEEIPFEIEVQEDEEKEVGYQEILQEGVVGKITRTYDLTYWQGQEVSRDLINTETTEPTNEIILKGTKIIIRGLATEDLGEIKYREKINVWATSYDGNCLGCTGRTATGKKVTHGICAVDPEVIPLGTAFYVPAYGICSAQDIGGGIKGNMVDLGFENVHEGWWSARYTDIYIIP